MKKLFRCLLLFSLFTIPLACHKEPPAPKAYPVTCYAASYGRGLYVTPNGGESWFPLDRDQTDLYAHFKRIYPDPDDKGILYITTTGAGLFKVGPASGDTEKISPFLEQNVTSLLFSRFLNNGMNPSLLIGLNGGGIFRSDKGLNQWQELNAGLSYHEINILFGSESDLYAGTTHDLFKWDKEQNRWLSSSRGIKNKNILALGGTPDRKILLAGSGGYPGLRGRFEAIPCLYKSLDRGVTWQPSDKGIPEGTLIYSLALGKAGPERCYAGTSEGVFRSIDGGAKWSKMRDGLPKEFRVFEIKMEKMKDGYILIYAAGSKGIFMTVDDQESGWVKRNYGLPQTAMTSIIISNN